MGSILIRKVPDVVHRKFKQACRARKISMEEAIVRLLAREVGEGRRGRPRTTGAKRRAAAAKRGAKRRIRLAPRKAAPRKPVRRKAAPRKAARRPARGGRRPTVRRTTRR